MLYNTGAREDDQPITTLTIMDIAIARSRCLITRCHYPREIPGSNRAAPCSTVLPGNIINQSRSTRSRLLQKKLVQWLQHCQNARGTVYPMSLCSVGVGGHSVQANSTECLLMGPLRRQSRQPTFAQSLEVTSRVDYYASAALTSSCLRADHSNARHSEM
jgi:hypothetical protein